MPDCLFGIPCLALYRMPHGRTLDCLFGTDRALDTQHNLDMEDYLSGNHRSVRARMANRLSCMHRDFGTRLNDCLGGRWAVTSQHELPLAIRDQVQTGPPPSKGVHLGHGHRVRPRNLPAIARLVSSLRQAVH